MGENGCSIDGRENTRLIIVVLSPIFFSGGHLTL